MLTEPVDSDGRESYLRGRIWQQQDQWLAGITGHQDSGNMRSLVQANALLVIPSGVKSMPAGSRVTAWVLGGDSSYLTDFA
jgi:molybdopterin molybdotransferase